MVINNFAKFILLISINVLNIFFKQYTEYGSCDSNSKFKTYFLLLLGTQNIESENGLPLFAVDLR